jgi:tripeptidyl-peptidase-1
LINDARFKAGKPALGFLNPALYAFAHQGFTDIVVGQSIGCIGVNIQFNTPLPGVSVSEVNFQTSIVY